MTDIPVEPLSMGAETRGPLVAEHRPRSGARAVLANVAVALASLGAALLLAELVVRLAAPQQLIVKRPDIWQPVDTLGWNHRPNVSTTINTGERTIHLYTDRDGFRVGRAGRVEAKRRVLLLGDSFMEALQVEYEQSFGGRLEAGLTAQLGEPVAVRNTGVGGWDPPQYLMQARRALARESYDLVLVSIFLGNDVVLRRVERYAPGAPVDAPFHQLRFPRRLTYGELVDAVLYPINDFLKARSHLFILAKKRAATLRMRAGLTADYFPEQLLRREATSPRWAVTAQMCRDIRDLARAHKTPAVFMLIPASFQVDTGAFFRALKGFNLEAAAVDLEQPERLLTDAMGPYHLDLVDVLAAFRGAASSGNRLYGTVDPHLSPEGHELLARLVEPVVAARLSASPSTRRSSPAAGS